MSGLDGLFSGLKAFITAADDLKSMKAELKLIDARERDLRQRVSYIEGVLANAGCAGAVAAALAPRLSAA